MADRLPDVVEAFRTQHPKVWEAYERLGAAAAEAGPLDEKTVRLCKLALAIGLGSEGAVHSHARRALRAGLSAEAVEQVATLAVTTIGWPRFMQAHSWIRDVTSGKRPG